MIAKIIQHVWAPALVLFYVWLITRFGWMVFGVPALALLLYGAGIFGAYLWREWNDQETD